RAAGSGVDLARAALEVKVLDFGIAKVVGNRSPNRTLTGSFLGTPYYCAPEQVFGHDVDARTDVYSLGATAFEMLTGAPPFVGAVPVILSSKATEEPPDLEKRGFPPRVSHTIRRMLAREPRHRAPSMAWVLEQVAGWETSRVVEIPTQPAGRPPAMSTDDWFAAGSDHAAITVLTRGDLAPGTTSQALRTLAAPRGMRKWVALAITGGVLAVAASVVLLGSSSRSTASTSPRGAVAPSPTEPSPTAASPTAASPTPASPTAASPTAASPTAASPTAASPNTNSSNTASPDSPTGSPTTASPTATSPTGASPTTNSPTATSPDPASQPPALRSGKPPDDTGSPRGVSRRPPKPPEKKPAKRPPVTRPPADPKDVLIVDPFSSTRSDSR
ncbi:MAG TPA: protein kinase, partial [Kofleriaceae bacterium]